MKFLTSLAVLIGSIALATAQPVLGPNSTIRTSNLWVSATAYFSNIILTNWAGTITGSGSGLTNLTATTVSLTVSNNLMNNSSNIARLMTNGLNSDLRTEIQNATNNTKIARTDYANYFTTSNNFSSVTSTSLITSSFLSATCGTGLVTIATSASTNIFYHWSYTNYYGCVGLETNASIVVTNAGLYRVSFGARIGGANGNTIRWLLFTNGVHCGLVNLVFLCTATTVDETGFKEAVIDLPANCRLDMRVANSAAANTTVESACLNIKGAN